MSQFLPSVNLVRKVSRSVNAINYERPRLERSRCKAKVARTETVSLTCELKGGGAVSFKLSNRWTRRVVSNAPYRAMPRSQYVRRYAAANCQAFCVRPASWKNRLGLKYGRPCSKGSRHRDLHAMMHRADLPRRESRDAARGT